MADQGTAPAVGCVVGVGLTEQAKTIDRPTISLMLAAADAALDDAGMEWSEIDGIAARWPGPGGTRMHPGSADWAELLRRPVTWIGDTYPQGIPAVADALGAIATSQCRSVLVMGGQSRVLGPSAVASYTRPENEFAAPWGAFTAAQFALVAQGFVREQPLARDAAAKIAAQVRNNGSVNPEAVMAGRGPYLPADVLAATPVVEPFTLLDLCLANEGAAALIVTAADRARDTRAPVEVRGIGGEWRGQQYVTAVHYDEVWDLGTDAARRALGQADLAADEIDVLELYDANSFELVRQLGVIGLCDPRESAAFALDADFSPEGDVPMNTDGGLLSHSHIGFGAPTLKIIEAVRQLRGEARSCQVEDASSAFVSGAGSAAKYFHAMVLAAP